MMQHDLFIIQDNRVHVEIFVSSVSDVTTRNVSCQDLLTHSDV